MAPEPEKPESSEEESDSESEPTQFTKKLSASTPDPKEPLLPPEPQKPESSEEEEEDDDEVEEESDSDPDPTQFTKKPSASTPAPKNSAPKPSESKSKKADPDSSVKNPTDDTKKPLFQRVWSEDDEIFLLKGMIDFSGDPTDTAFLDIIKNKVDIVGLTRTQLQAKIRRMKQKYMKNQSKAKEGKDILKPHEQKAYELSKTIWGRAHAESLVPAAKRVKSVGGSQERRNFGDEMFEEGILAERWEKLKKEEVDAYMRLMDVKNRQMKFVMENWKSG